MNLTTRKIVRGNSLIMKFLGVKPDETGWCNGWELQEKGLPFSPGAMGNGLYNPPFHKDWNWLMAVVEKIEKDLKEEFRVVVFEDECSIYQKTVDGKLQLEFISVQDAIETSKIEAVWLAVTNFLEWYNENKN